MDGVVIGSELRLGSPHKGKELDLPAERCRVDPPLHPLRPPKASLLSQGLLHNNYRIMVDGQAMAADRSAGGERSCNRTGNIWMLLEKGIRELRKELL